MSAAEKLKALNGRFELLRVGDLPPTTVELRFWPQIVAVVEAAEHAIGAGRFQPPPGPLPAALAALDEALT